MYQTTSEETNYYLQNMEARSSFVVQNSLNLNVDSVLFDNSISDILFSTNNELKS